MPRKPKQEKTTINVVVDGVAVAVTLHPPTKQRRSWYAYWSGLIYSKSTGQRHLKDAIATAENMVRNGGKKETLADSVLSDDEFDEIQRRHFLEKKRDSAKRKRSQKSYDCCMEAISAFRAITGLKPITTATPDDCEQFQIEASHKPKNWRANHKQEHEDETRDDTPLISPNTVLKWSSALQAAFERANQNSGRKCVRGVVEEKKLLSENPWRKFTWIEGRETQVRQFDGEELLSLLTHLEQRWAGVSVATVVAKTFLWSWGRKSEIVGLRWDDLREVGEEIHFEIVGKWGVDKWFRIPKPLCEELKTVRIASPFVFAAYNLQLREFYRQSRQPWQVNRVAEDFNPTNLGDWFYERVKEWSEALPNGSACVHVFRKTALQYARAGEDLNRQVAADARLGERVMMTHYAKETDEEMRQKSNRTYWRIAASLPRHVAIRYGFEESPAQSLEDRLKAAIEAQNWDLAHSLTAELARRGRSAG